MMSKTIANLTRSQTGQETQAARWSDSQQPTVNVHKDLLDLFSSKLDHLTACFSSIIYLCVTGGEGPQIPFKKLHNFLTSWVETV